ncbi:TetR family transcriptional regulator [Paenibacillus sp. J31TS4]|uniref:TetR/AcrR family transcriptional regulator n=1 Tax=Paenibacillus sp. J31TS4 TaxID=2807195 RepID=UPI001B1570FD|nr:TetR/AcrR family transcriptional regulator [Paenibacillus sp. J31TS4]GIP38165.1 TetR family transcriptional regulator [Paenibacillus sp. J31TS4]
MNNRENDGLEELDSLPNGVKLSWGLGKQPKRGPKGELSVEQIVEAAVAIADREGLAAVSMSRVAGALGFTTMSLYRYLSSKEDLLVLMQDAASAVPIPPQREEADWRDEMREYVRETIRVFREHPWYGDLPITGVPVTPNVLRFVEWGLRTMREFPLSDYEKMSIILLLSSYARSCGIIEQDLGRLVREGGDPDSFSGLSYTAALRRLVDADRYPYLHPLVMSGVYTGEKEDENPVGDDMEFGLERILDGIQHYLDTKQGKEPAAEEEGGN